MSAQSNCNMNTGAWQMSYALSLLQRSTNTPLQAEQNLDQASVPGVAPAHGMGRQSDQQELEAGAQMCALMPDSDAVICVLDISQVTAIICTLITISV